MPATISKLHSVTISMFDAPFVSITLTNCDATFFANGAVRVNGSDSKSAGARRSFTTHISNILIEHDEAVEHGDGLTLTFIAKENSDE
jgi:hypothetical protein